MDFTEKPRLDLARKILPPPLFEALARIFAQPLPGSALVGGTALAGFYAGHRRSDDLDIFTDGAANQQVTVPAVQALKGSGVTFDKEFRTPQFYKAHCEFRKYRFTIDVVEDLNLFRIGQFFDLPENIRVAGLSTLFMNKASTLISRCSEKDLYDLFWLFEQVEGLASKDLIEAGHRIDLGITAESLLISISGTVLREEACGFALNPQITPAQVFKELSRFQKELLKGLSVYLKNQPAPKLRELVQKIRKHL